jgi:peptide-methionine (S)-S-oxide reductase
VVTPRTQVSLPPDSYKEDDADPTAYREVCSGRTGHAEAVQLTYQTGSVGYGELVEFFYRTHDPTTVDRQGPDRGSRKLTDPTRRGTADVLEYRSAIFTHSSEQEAVAKEVTAQVQEK